MRILVQKSFSFLFFWRVGGLVPYRKHMAPVNDADQQNVKSFHTSVFQLPLTVCCV